MRWSLTIGRIFGITLRLHVTFLLLLAVIGYMAFVNGGWHDAAWALALVCAIFACIGLHELGHSVIAQQLGVQVKSITLLPIGGVAALKRIPENPWYEIAITLAGPLVNLIIAVALAPLVFHVDQAWLPQFHLIRMPYDGMSLLQAIFAANVTLFAFNFIPAFPMDGGRLLRAVLALVISYRRATAIAALLGQALAVVFILAGFNGPVMLIVIGAFIFIAAEGEDRLVRMRSQLRDVAVHEVMSREFATLSPLDTVQHGLEMVYRRGQEDFPVVEGGHVIGLVTQQDMIDARNDLGPDVPVADIMRTKFRIVSPEARLAQVYEDMMTEGNVSFPVMDDNQLVGFISPANIARFLAVRSSFKLSRRARRQRAAGQTPALPPVIATGRRVASPPPRAESDPTPDRA